ncbi:CoA pyrophosphatase [Xinfangfangia sp. D13-10-4-6]|uniref:CoA pyrophosphatase n=1 Tax=Pseudogemmobacter hezensis TaxID=2737662 RepID=UPI0015525B0F|nr:CoA pyrophosphatase [Pseudogemmobacter hezensis]NPD15411.1 CoA pyrophosphatase [Pseudogemmobacter hezensis]
MRAEPASLALPLNGGENGDLVTDLRQLLSSPTAAAASSDYDLNPGIRLPEGRILRPAAVLIPVLADPRGARVMLTKRSSQLKHHPGQIAFPGGKTDAADTSPEATALREAWEETGLPPGSVSLIGRLPQHETVTGFQITPVLGLIDGPFTPRPEAGEVDEIFTVPLAHLLSIPRYAIERRMWRGDWRRYYTVPWGPWYIWGATARILRGLAGRYAEHQQTQSQQLQNRPAESGTP